MTRLQHRLFPSCGARTATRLGTLLLVCVSPVAAQGPPPERPPPPAPAQQELQLDTTTIAGSRELPTVLNILPWKRAPAGELRGRPDDSLLEDVLAPVNRVEFRRELRYQLTGDAQ